MGTYFSKEMKRCNYLNSEIDRAYHEIARNLGLSDSALRILYAICDSGESRMLQEICKVCGVSKQTVNSALRKLEGEGIVYLESAGSKNKNVCLTDKGKELVQGTVAQVIQAENEIFASWPSEDVEAYLNLTEKYLNAIREKAQRMRGRER
ncbi:MAG: MarR family transcriptional regulator [Roseburia sp.]|nr:MarR family transcriptional regulator [Roseburia sp.]